MPSLLVRGWKGVGTRMEDKEIVDLYWERSQRAIAESKSKYGACCNAIAYRILQSREDADECENDTYLRAWNAMPPSRPAFLGAFLSRIARNLSLDVLEKRRAVKRGGGELALVLHELEECVADLRVDMEFDDAEGLSLALDAFLRGLSKEARVFFVQRYWMSYSIAEVASQNSVSEGKVKMSLLRTRRLLRKFLDERDGEYEVAG